MYYIVLEISTFGAVGPVGHHHIRAVNKVGKCQITQLLLAQIEAVVCNEDNCCILPTNITTQKRHNNYGTYKTCNHKKVLRGVLNV